MRGFAGGEHKNQTVSWQVKRSVTLWGVRGFSLILYVFMLSVSSASDDEGFFLGTGLLEAWCAAGLRND